MAKQTRTDRVLERAIDLITGRKDSEDEFDLAIEYLGGTLHKDSGEKLRLLKSPLSCFENQQSEKKRNPKTDNIYWFLP